MPGNKGRDMIPANLVHETTWIAKLTKRHECPFDQRVSVAQGGRLGHPRHRQRSSRARNRMREICTSGSVGGEDGNVLAYPAQRRLRHLNSWRGA